MMSRRHTDLHLFLLLLFAIQRETQRTGVYFFFKRTRGRGHDQAPVAQPQKNQKGGDCSTSLSSKLDRSQAAAPTSTFEVVNLFLSTEHGNMEMICSMQAKGEKKQQQQKKKKNLLAGAAWHSHLGGGKPPRGQKPPPAVLTFSL